MTLRLLHLSDLHLDRAFAGVGAYGDVAQRRREGLRHALQLAGRTARERGCDALTIGGDLYEAEHAGPQTAAFLAALFASWQPLRVFLAAGNHDPFMPGSIYERTDWPDNVHVFSENQLRPVPLGDGVTLWGLSHRDPAWMGDPLGGQPVGAEGGLHIALFHGAELGSRPRNKSIHGPFHAGRIRAQGFALALCGHYHRRRLDTASGLVYPGSPEPLTFDEEGVRGPVLAEIEPGGAIRLEELTLNRWHAVQADCDVEGAPSAAEVLDRVRATSLEVLRGLPGDRAMLRLTLRGELPVEAAVDTGVVEAAVHDVTGAGVVRIRDVSRAAIDVEAAAADPTTRGEFTRSMLAARDRAGDDEAELAVVDDALRYGLQALSGCDVGLR